METNKVKLNHSAVAALEEGNFTLAKQHCQKELKSGNRSEALHFLGVIAFFEQDFEQAEQYIKQAVSIDPDNQDFNFNLAKIYQNKGNIQQAIKYYSKVASISDEIVDVYLELSVLYWQIDDSKLALKYAMIGVEKSNYKLDFITHFIDITNNVNILKWDPKMEAMVLKILDYKVNYQQLSKLICLGIKEKLKKIKGDKLFTEKELEIFNDKFILKSLKKVVLCDFDIEKAIIFVRKSLLVHFAINFKLQEKWFPLLLSIATQSDLNEFVYMISGFENKILGVMEHRLFEHNSILLLFACYKSLANVDETLINRKYVQENDNFVKKIIKTQVLDMRDILSYKNNINVLTEIEDSSTDVCNQYEKFPYPRWSTIAKPTLDFRHEWYELFPHEPVKENVKEVLIAGCGTGNQAVHSSWYYSDANIKAIDLSLSSLAYAYFKTKENNCLNIKYYQADILNLDKVTKYQKFFDVIECIGVLHHIKDFEKGFENLISCLKNNGLLKLGLYSKFARQNIIELREVMKLPEDLDGDVIQKLRNKLMQQHFETLAYSYDCYTTSNFKDLILNSYERQFTLLELKQILKEYNLRFIGFVNLSSQVKLAYKQYNPNDEYMTSLDSWHEFERHNPGLFCGMYQFWVSTVF